MAEQSVLSFGGLLRQLRAGALLTQEELAEAARLSPRSVSDLERGVNRTARKDTAGLLADALGLAEPERGLFIAAALGRGRAEDVLAARDGKMTGPGQRAGRWAGECPYRGLLPFGEADAEVFYGRERLAAELAVKLAARAADGGLVVVTGASGSGKSSLLRAGLLPILARGQQIPGSDRWPRIVMTPGKDPLAELAAQLAAVGGPDALAVRDELARHPSRAHLAIRSAVLAAAARRDEQPLASGDDTARLVLIVDQFEQVFTLSPGPGGETTRQAFITALCASVANPGGPGALVVIAVRGDFWDRCAAVPELVSALQDGQFVVGPMTGTELRVAITGPAQAAGLDIDSGLTETIVGDLGAADSERSAGVLPLLSQAMALTWEHRDNDRLTSHGYAQAGGVSHAVQTAADRTYDTLPAGQQAIARQVLLAMTIADRDGALARRPVTRDELYAALPDAARGDIGAILDAFAAGRLAVLDGDSAQLSHDVLLHAWPRLRRWLEEDQASWILHGQLADAAAAWHDSRHDPSFLYRGTQLAAARQAATRWSANPARSPALIATERGFLNASERAADRSTRRQRAAVALLAALTALAVIAAGFAYSQRSAALQQRDQAIASQVTAEALQYATSDTTLAAQLTLAAYRFQPTRDLYSRLLATENTPLSAPPLADDSAPVDSVAFTSDGTTLATASYDGTVRLWNVADPARPRLLSQLPADTSGSLGGIVAFSPRGHTLAAVPVSGSVVQLWDVTDPKHPRLLPRQLGSGGNIVESAAFSPDGTMLAIGGENNNSGTISLWDVTNPAHPVRLAELRGNSDGGDVASVAFSPDGRTLAAGDDGDGSISLWDLTDPAHPGSIGTLGIPATSIWSLAFTRDGKTLASGDSDGTVELWDLTDPASPGSIGQLLGGNSEVVCPAAFSPDGDTLATVTADGIRLWNVADPARPRPLGQPLADSSTTVASLAISPSGLTLAAGNDDGTIRLWSLPQTVLPGGSDPVASVAFSHDGRILASGDYEGTIKLWNLADPAHPRLIGQPVDGGGSAVTSVAVSPRGPTLADSDFGDTTRLWDLANPVHPRPIGPLPDPGVPASVAFSPDGRTLANGNYDGTIQLWDTTNPAHPRQLGQLPDVSSSLDSTVDSIAFSPDGQTLTSGDDDGTIQLWDITNPAHPRQLGPPLIIGNTAVTAMTPGPDGTSVAFSPDGRILATGKRTKASSAYGGTIQLWDITNPAHPRQLGPPLTSGTSVDSVAFSLNGQTLASGTYGGTIELWDTTDPASPSALGPPLAISTGPVYSVAFSPDGSTLASGDDGGKVELWNLNVQYAIERICATTGGLTPGQWNQYLPQIRYRPSCAH